MSNYPTPHIKAKPKDFAKTVLMPGDPLRSKLIAETFLSDAKLINNVRGVQGYTGTYKGAKITVMASGMGMPSMGIYSHELYTVFGVENIMRIGSAGAIRSDIELCDIVMGMGACTDSSFQWQFNLPGTFATTCDFGMLRTCADIAETKKLRYRVGNLLSSDVFYYDDEAYPKESEPITAWSRMGVMAIDMESAALYMNAARTGKRALAICTISDQLIKKQYLSAEERQTSFTTMMELALETALELDKK